MNKRIQMSSIGSEYSMSFADNRTYGHNHVELPGGVFEADTVDIMPALRSACRIIRHLPDLLPFRFPIRRAHCQKRRPAGRTPHWPPPPSNQRHRQDSCYSLRRSARQAWSVVRSRETTPTKVSSLYTGLDSVTISPCPASSR